MELKNYFAQDSQGNAQPNAVCHLYFVGTQNYATGLHNATDQILTNPFTSDGNGLIQFKAPDGLYDLRVVSGVRDYKIQIQFLDVATQVTTVTTAAEQVSVDAETASDAADRATTAANAAQLSGKVYATTALGLAVTTNGGYFNVPVTGGNDALVLYRNDSGVATEIQRYLSSVGIAGMIRRSSSKDILRVIDSTGKGAMRLTRNGKFLVLGRDVLTEIDTALELTENVQFTGSAQGGSIALRDAAGKAPFKITRTGRLKVMGRDILREIDALGSGDAFTEQLANINKMLTPNKNLLIVGDSLSAYTGSWARTITNDLTDPNRTSTILAVGGHTSSQQAGRLGALPFLVTLQDNKILATGATNVTNSQMLAADGVTLMTVWPVSPQGTGPTFRARVSGVLGTFSSTTYTGETPTALVFTPDAGQLTVDLPVEVCVPTESVWAVGHEYDTLLIGIGRNNFQDTATVKRDWLAVKNWQATLNKRCILVTPPNMSGEGITSSPTKYAAIVELEKYAQELFGEYAIISRQILMRHPNTSIQGDLDAVADGRVPPSLTSDGLHWIPETGHTYIRAAAAAVINRKGY